MNDRRRSMLSIQTGDIPQGYKRVSYLQANGSAYIDTGIIATSNTKARITGIFNMDSPNVFGRQPTGIQFSIRAENRVFYTAKYGTQAFSIRKQTSGESVIEVSKEAIYYNGNLIAVPEQEQFEMVSTLILFGIGSGDGTYILKGVNHRISRLEIFENDTPTRDLQSFLNENDKPCMYDFVTKQPFYNLASGNDFPYGEVIG